MTYDAVADFAQTWGLVLFIAAFVLIVAYAVWPKNKKTFDDAARIPLEDDKPKADDRRDGRNQE
ncbi:cbb3-type cytochrome c oxidase subunit 3 [Amorphus orientalis]|uniref:Cytochrome c oxidase cbb3-type subunit 4 n=1 Tax=Amorphus orientalis TaxID=649198 RepID=A0AAE3VND1_9HYPH|nr:cbb3-type cytochrome c oxidase subunit 3 [Amorphus orientalis]MDQ0315093.1 cytochrome c oxidase cbb3-type subunit 4 [Amorphus orientalis]